MTERITEEQLYAALADARMVTGADGKPTGEVRVPEATLRALVAEVRRYRRMVEDVGLFLTTSGRLDDVESCPACGTTILQQHEPGCLCAGLAQEIAGYLSDSPTAPEDPNASTVLNCGEAPPYGSREE